MTIVVLSFILTWVLVNRGWFFTPLVLTLVLVVVVWSLIHYVEKTSRNLSLFLLNIKQGGFRSTFKNKNDPKQHLYNVFDDVIEEFHQATLAKESHALYLQTLNENIGVGLISYDEQGKIDLINPSAKALLQKPNLIKIEQLQAIDKSLVDTVTQLTSGQRTLVKVVIDGELKELTIQSKKFSVQEKNFTLLMIQDINMELEQKEIEAWQKLIRVLTHEIMNTVTPISSLSGALHQQLQDVTLTTLSVEDQEDIKKSLETIATRSKGLMRFVNAYKEYTKSPELHYSQFSLDEMLGRMGELFSAELRTHQIAYTTNTSPKAVLRADKNLIEQALINLIKNAIEALQGQPHGRIAVTAEHKSHQWSIQVTDNGSGLSEEDRDRIFVPFYTTKQHGTGVGLSFVRKVMRLHHGQIKVTSGKGEGTRFTLLFQHFVLS